MICVFWVVIYYEGKFYLYCLVNYYYSGIEIGEIKVMFIYVKEIKKFVEWCYIKWKYFFWWNWFFVDLVCKILRIELDLIGIEIDKVDNNSFDKVLSNGLKIEVGIECF